VIAEPIYDYETVGGYATNFGGADGIPNFHPQAPPPEPKHEGMVDKIRDKVHIIERNVENAVHNVEHKVMDEVHDAEHKVADVVHSVHDKVSGFFGMIGSLFHKKGKGAGPAGNTHGVGSTVVLTALDGSKHLGHFCGNSEDCHRIQVHTNDPGMVSHFPMDAVISIVPVTNLSPIVGSGVEVLWDGRWYPGYVLHLPLVGEDPPLYKVHCYGDDEGQVTFADQFSIRPLLSPEEQEIVTGHMIEVAAEKAAEDKANAEAAAAIAQANAANRAKVDFQNKLDAAGLSAFYPHFIDFGYDTEESLEHMHDDELVGFGMKAGHLSKFYQAFPRGEEYVITNYHLKTTAQGIAYRASKSMTADSHKVAKFDTTVIGTEQIGGWLKVGNLYLPIEVDGAKVIFPKGQDPKEEPKSVVSKVEEKVAAVANKVSSGLHSFAHMLHFE
jgi:hypothetical protein